MGTFKKILFPTDFSENSDQALSHAMGLIDFRDSELIVQHVVNDYFERTPHWTTLFDIRELQIHLDSFVEREMTGTLRSISDGVHVRKVISKGRPAEEICALAEKEFVDLVIMGSAAGAVTNNLIRTTTRPVLAVSSRLPASAGTGAAKRILVATDFSEHSRRIAKYAFDIRKAVGATIYLLHVIETTKSIEFALKQGHYMDATERMKEWAMNQLLNLIPDESLNDPGVIRMVEIGKVSKRIPDVARKIEADLTVLGAHEYGTIHKTFLGTTADRLLSTLDSPMLTVRI